MNQKEERLLVFSGDVHGLIPGLVARLCDEMQLVDTDCIVCGDFGVGFDNSWNNTYAKIEKKLKKANNHLWVVRGNHDNPEYFQEEGKYSKEYVTFMEDYKIYDINGKKILPIGGATSTDRDLRTEGKDWWPGEVIKRVELKTLPVRVDVIVSHQCPMIFDPIHTRFDDEKEELYDEIVDERKYLDTIAFNVKADYWYYGHHHEHFKGDYKGITWTCLGIDNRLRPEIAEYREKEEKNPQGEEEETN